jgi:hypothetical protein
MDMWPIQIQPHPGAHGTLMPGQGQVSAIADF